MVEASADNKNDYELSPEEQLLVTKHLGEGTYIVDKKRKSTVVLSREQADWRKSVIQEVEYDFALALQKGDYFLGNAVINFYLTREIKDSDPPLFINSQALAVASLTINDRPAELSPESFQNQVIPLRPKDVVQGWNTVQLRYLTPYNKNRVGLHTFTDSADQQQYLYSQFEAFHCFRVFPCFDQPNLKAKMSLIVLCPQDWQAVSNSIETRYTYSDEDKKGAHILERAGIEWFTHFYEDSKMAICDFEQTPRISTYLYAICAGPYKVFSDSDPMYVPQRIFVRQSLVEFLRHELMFGITKTTLDFYQRSFGARYPFTKVDHVMSPDYKYGAMENVGCITYSDEIMCSEKHMSVPKLTFFCVVIQHELCHMWFGNLVTMKWWNDLWLNEAFATSLSYKACSEGGAHVDAFKDESWLHMSGYKRWGLAEDLMPSNHKIQADCPNTDTAESLIDGITYGKGSSMIKQLIFLMGWETFCKGLQIYFKKFAWSNTELGDFIGSMQQGFDENKKEGETLDLNNWSQKWLQTKGVNKHSAEVEETDGNFTKFVIRQTPCKNAEAIFREQRINIGFYDDEGQLVEKIENVKVQEEELTTIECIAGKKVPAAVLLNSDDWGFGHFTMEDTAMKVFEEKLGKMQSKIDRAVVIGQLITMMRQIQYPATRMPLIMNQLLDETNQNLINALFGAFSMAQNTYLPPETVPRFNKETAQFFLKKAKQDRESDELVRFCIDKALSFTSSEEHLRQISGWILNDKVVIDEEELKVELTNNQKYSIVKQYWANSAFSLDEKKALRDKALENDNTDNAQNVKKVLDYSLPDAAIKERLWEEILDESSGCSLMDTRLKIQGFWQRHAQPELMAPYFEKYYATLKRVIDTRDREFAESFMQNLSPAFMAREQDENAFGELLSRCTDDTHFFTIFLKKQVDMIEIIKKSRHLCETFRID